ncbi:hypothetical protein [Eubacterium callanderi]|uniref:hypothetical protein n=1 Tax=Eubacterium callanderi TaxID=53442 RepID=UPI00241FF5FD|nr:hypothetical protein [Eubacterium callanderi]
MKTKIYNSLFSKTMIILFCLFIAINPFFQPKRVEANPVVLFGAVGLITMGLIGAGYIRDAAYTPEQQNQINEKATQYLQEAFPDPIDYNKQMNILQNLNEKAINGEEVDWSKYSGKALYAVLKGVVDVVWPFTVPDNFIGTINRYYILALKDGEGLLLEVDKSTVNGCPSINYLSSDNYGWNRYRCSSFNQRPSNGIIFYHYIKEGGHIYKEGPTIYPDSDFYFSSNNAFIKKMLTSSNVQKVPNITAKTANKVKLPTRLPQTVINNINNYYNGDTENLTIALTPEELPTLPDGYNPNTDDLINLPGYEDVTPDQEPSGDPEPTPTPTPPEPTPEYNGDRWVNPIGDFMDGLLKFMKAAFVPTLSLNLDALNSMPDNLSEKFPFSLPGDLVRLFSVFQAEPVPFAFDWEIDFTPVGAGKIPIKGDLSMFDEYAPLFRNLAFIAFIIGLAWKTFGMFFGGGDE